MKLKSTCLSYFDNLELKEAIFHDRSFPMHIHDTYSIGIIEQGIEKLDFGDKEVLVPPKSVVIINPFISHANSCFDGDKVHYRAIYIGRDIFDFIRKKEGHPTLGQPIWFDQAPLKDLQLYNLLLDFHTTSDKGNEQKLGNIIGHLLLNHIVEPSSCRKVSDNHLLVTEAMFFLKTNLFNKVDLESLSAKLMTNKFKLIRSFKAATGLTPIAYQIVHRIDAAKKMMRQQTPLTEIALATGFYDQSHFIHCFKEYVGVTPTEYRAGLIFH